MTDKHITVVTRYVESLLDIFLFYVDNYGEPFLTNTGILQTEAGAGGPKRQLPITAATTDSMTRHQRF